MSFITEDNLTPTHPFFIRYDKITQADEYNRIHHHRAVEILYIAKGSTHIILDYKLYSLKEGDIVFINSDIAHSLLVENANETEIFYVQFLPELIYDYRHNFFNITYFIWLVACKDNNFLIYNTEENSEPVLNIKSAYNIYQGQETGYEPAFISRILLVCAWFFERSKDIAFSSQPHFSYTNIVMLNDIFKTIENNHSTVSVTEITKKLSLSPEALRVFCNITGYPLRKYIQNYRISLAKYLLSSTDMPITEIVYNIGYNDSSYFSKLMTTHTGHTPSEFRKKNKISEYIKKCRNNEAEIPCTDILPSTENSQSDTPFYSPIFLSAYYDPRTRTAYRTEEFYEIIYNDVEGCDVTVADRTYTLTPGDIIIIAPRERYRIVSHNEQNRIMRIQFYLDIFNIGNYRPDFIDTLGFYTKNNYRYFKLSTKDSYITQSLFSIYDQHLKFEASSEIIMRAGIMDITSWILRKQHEACPDIDKYEQNKSNATMQRIIGYVDNYYVENLTLEHVADKFFVNYSYLSRMFKKVTGQRFSRYINSKRLMRASFLLATTDYSIGQIASMVGYCSRSRFAEKFIQNYEVSPTEYRKKHKEKVPIRAEHKSLRK